MVAGQDGQDVPGNAEVAVVEAIDVDVVRDFVGDGLRTSSEAGNREVQKRESGPCEPDS